MLDVSVGMHEYDWLALVNSLCRHSCRVQGQFKANCSFQWSQLLKYQACNHARMSKCAVGWYKQRACAHTSSATFRCRCEASTKLYLQFMQL